MSKSREERLYYACLHYCEAYFNLISEDRKMDKRHMTEGVVDEELDKRIMEHHRNFALHRFDTLRELVKEIEKD